MTSAKLPFPRALRVLLTASAAVAAAILLLGAQPAARAATASQLRQQISAGQGRVSALAGAVNSADRRVHALSVNVASLSSQVARLQADLNAKRLELLKLRSELAAARARLAQLEARQARDEAVLSQQLVGTYESDRPDIVSVVLESTGFNNLLERLAFAQRINHQDAQITGQVKAARRAVAAEATRLGALSLRQQQLTDQVLAERNQVDRDRLAVLAQEISAARARDAKAGQLRGARGHVDALRGALNSLLAAQARAARAAAARSAPATGAGPSQPAAGSPVSAGGFTFPLPKSAVVPPGAWSLDDGVDMAAPGGTPEYAVCSGTIVLHGIGGFGPSAPVIHCDSPLAGYSYVYYGHAGPGNWTPVGTHVSAGQVISEVGYGIVGFSTGPHIEIGFADSSGSPIGPGSAPAMAALLHASYGG